ncbi:hypothetical protein Scep_024655 [Stephania cephalantha]|uniref:Pectinesterase n=1 Tax=Stephania cephalantha TaxID=152367 RepID=A0AAP0EZR3_9MAGN
MAGQAALLVTIHVLLIVQLVPRIDAALDPALVVAEKSVKVIKVRKDGSGDFKTVRDAVNNVPSGNTKRTIIYIGPGEYKEKVTIERTKPFVTFYGSSSNMPIISYDGTKIQNSAPKPDGKRLNGEQAVAMRISGDKAAFYNCKFLGYQDTLCDDKGNHFFQNCYIEGTVDFIFGDGRSLYLGSELHSIAEGESAITAQGKEQAGDDGGFAFVHCKITGTGNTYLGRAWKERAKVVFAYTYMGTLVNPEGWSDKGFTSRDK